MKTLYMNHNRRKYFRTRKSLQKLTMLINNPHQRPSLRRLWCGIPSTRSESRRAASDFIIAAHSIPIAQSVQTYFSMTSNLYTELSAHHEFASLQCCWKTELYWECDQNHVDATWTQQPPPLQSKAAPCVLNLQRYGSTDRQTQSRTATEQSGKTCLDRAYRLFSVISAYLAAAFTASAGRASPERAQKDGDRACLRPESREKAPASSSHTVWFSLLDKHSECWSMSHPQAAISALSRRPTAQLFLSRSLTCREYNLRAA